MQHSVSIEISGEDMQNIKISLNLSEKIILNKSCSISPILFSVCLNNFLKKISTSRAPPSIIQSFQTSFNCSQTFIYFLSKLVFCAVNKLNFFPLNNLTIQLIQLFFCSKTSYPFQKNHRYTSVYELSIHSLSFPFVTLTINVLIFIQSVVLVRLIVRI